MIFRSRNYLLLWLSSSLSSLCVGNLLSILSLSSLSSRLLLLLTSWLLNYSLIFFFPSFRTWPYFSWFRNFGFSWLSSLCWLSLRLFKQLIFWSWYLFCLCTLLLSFSSSLWLILLLWILWIYSFISLKRISLSSRLLIISNSLCCYLLFFLLF